MKSILPDLKAMAKKAEEKRGLIKKKKNIDAHKSYSLKKVKEMGAAKVYPK